jgi:alkanesulfonate monooxygenase SsuD/methylene tetrahydromethanopterin reductase-like flavin-dependent oxidoreductase (luciferase family)
MDEGRGQEEVEMKFSLYSEIQHWPGRSWERQYREVMEQLVHADRLGYSAYGIIEHFFFPKFSISANPFALFASCAPQTRQITFRTLGHVLPYHNPTILASQIAMFDQLYPGRYEFGALRGHGWIPAKAGVPVVDSRNLYEESLDILFTALENERFSYDGEFYKIDDSHIVPRPKSRFRVFLGGTSDRTYELAAERGWAIVVPPLLPYAALKEQLDLYRSKCAEHGTEPDIVWIHACYLDDDRATARREAEQGMKQFLAGNASPLTGDDRLPPAADLEAAGYGFYLSGILEQLAETPYEEMIDGDIVWVGTPNDVIERIEAVKEVCDGLTEISITVNAGGLAHWQAIKAQELFADRVIPHFRQTAAVGDELPALA